jgi:hypothetical protein
MSRSWRIALLAVVLVAVAALLVAQELRAVRVVVCTRIEKAEPIGAAQAFPPDVGTLICFTQIANNGEGTTVVHVWRYGESEMARITLPVSPSDDRTWSFKRVSPAWTGVWRVVIEDGHGRVLGEARFTLGK